MPTIQGKVFDIRREVTGVTRFLIGHEKTECHTKLAFTWHEGDLVIVEGEKDGEGLDAASISSFAASPPPPAATPKIYRWGVAVVIAGATLWLI
jgi:hypothetical protein